MGLLAMFDRTGTKRLARARNELVSLVHHAETRQYSAPKRLENKWAWKGSFQSLPGELLPRVYRHGSTPRAVKHVERAVILLQSVANARVARDIELAALEGTELLVGPRADGADSLLDGLRWMQAHPSQHWDILPQDAAEHLRDAVDLLANVGSSSVVDLRMSDDAQARLSVLRAAREGEQTLARTRDQAMAAARAELAESVAPAREAVTG